jgi:hypothetical protein
MDGSLVNMVEGILHEQKLVTIRRVEQVEMDATGRVPWFPSIPGEMVLRDLL